MPTLTDRYQLGELVYSDSSVLVYRGRDQVLNRDVTVELLRESCAADPRYCQRLVDKARAAALINLPNVASLYDQQAIGDRPFLVIEELAGPPLAHVAPLPPDHAIGLVQAIATTFRAALARQHALPIINEQTVRMGVEGRVQIVDLGLDQAPPHEAAAVQQLGQVLQTALGPDATPSPLHAVAQRAVAGQYPTIDALLHDIGQTEQRASSTTTVMPRVATVVIPPAQHQGGATQGWAAQPPIAQPIASPTLKRSMWPWLAGAGVLLALVVGGLAARGETAQNNATASAGAAQSSGAPATGAAQGSTAPAASGDAYVVAARGSASVRVRSGPGTSFNQVASLPNGTIVQVISPPQAADNYNWVQIRADGVEGWCILEALRKP